MEIQFDEGNLGLLAALAAGEFGTLRWYRLAHEASLLSSSDGFERLLAAETLPDLELYAHQEMAVRRVLQNMRGRAVLADEVGLGKTIEAGVIIREYILRGLVRRALVLVPASLVGQWEEELTQRLRLDFRVITTATGWAREKFGISSIDLAKRQPHAPIILRQPYDLVIVDEAHKLKNRSTQNWKFINRIHKKYLLLLTATPIQNDLRELYNMITLLKPGQLSTFSEFRRQFMAGRRTAKNTTRLRALLGEVMVRTNRREALLSLPKRSVRTLAVEPEGAEREFLNGVTALVRGIYRVQTKERRNLLPLILLLREATSSPPAALATLGGLLRQSRHRRRAGTGGTGGAGEAAAFLPADFSEEVENLIRLGEKAVPSTKARLLVELAERSAAESEKVLVFTEFLATAESLRRQLAEKGIGVTYFHGGLTLAEKDAAVAAFRREKTIMVSTEAGGEGRNLQFCHRLVNFDLPWNPMRVEQRIGRLHRLGQKRDVEIINFSTAGTVEEYVLFLLHEKIRMFEAVVGELDVILDNLEGRSLESSIAAIILGSRNENEARAGFAKLGDKLVEAIRQYEALQELTDALLAPGQPVVESAQTGGIGLEVAGGGN